MDFLLALIAGLRVCVEEEFEAHIVPESPNRAMKGVIVVTEQA
jgi:hypothetical protein